MFVGPSSTLCRRQCDSMRRRLKYRSRPCFSLFVYEVRRNEASRRHPWVGPLYEAVESPASTRRRPCPSSRMDDPSSRLRHVVGSRSRSMTASLPFSAV